MEDLKWLKSLDKCSIDKAQKLLNEVGEWLCGWRNPPRCDQYSEIGAEEFEDLIHNLSQTMKALCEDSTFLDGFNSNTASNDHKVYSDRIIEITKKHKDRLKQMLSDHSKPVRILKDFDWQLEVVVASNKMAAQQTPVLGLTLKSTDVADESSLDKDQSNFPAKSQDFRVEIDRNQVLECIDQLENCLQLATTNSSTPSDVFVNGNANHSSR